MFIHLNEHKKLSIRDYTERKKFLEFQDRFATACGLAMQGLDQVPFSVDMLPHKKLSFFSRVKSSFRKKQVPAAWGFDFGYSCFKAVRVTYDDEGVLAVDECFHCHHPYDGLPDDGSEKPFEKMTEMQIAQLLKKQEEDKNPFMREDDSSTVWQPVNQEQFQSLAIESFLSKYQYQGEAICVGYPAHDILCANIKLPQMPPQQTQQAIRYEVKHHLPDNSHLFQTGYLVLGWEEDEQNLLKQYIHLFSARIETIENKLLMLQKHGIAPNLMASNVLANLNYAYLLLTLPPVEQPPFPTEEQTQPPQNDDFEPPEIQSILVCDMGTLGTDLTFYNLREIQHFYLGIGGQDFTKAIAQSLGEPFPLAEAIKRNPTKRANDTAKVVEALKPVAKRLVDEILLRLQYFCKSGTVLDKVVVLGGGFQLKGFAGYFKNLLHVTWKNSQ